MLYMQCGQWQIQDFPEEGALTPRGGANLLFGQFFSKTAWKWRNFAPEGCTFLMPLLDLPLAVNAERKGAGELGGARKTRPLSLTEAPRQLIVSKGFLRFQRPMEAHEWGGARGQRGAKGTRSMSLTEDPKLLKVSKGSQGFLRPQGGPKSPGGSESKGNKAPKLPKDPRLLKAPKASWGSRGSGVRGARGQRGAKGTRPMSLTEDPKLLKVSNDFLRPQGGPKSPGGSESKGKQGP